MQTAVMPAVLGCVHRVMPRAAGNRGPPGFGPLEWEVPTSRHPGGNGERMGEIFPAKE